MDDLRVSSGLFFSLLGLILCAVGIFSPATQAPLTEVNVNLYTGIVMVVFGGVMLWLARRRV